MKLIILKFTNINSHEIRTYICTWVLLHPCWHSIFDNNLRTQSKRLRTARMYHMSRLTAFYMNNDVSFIFRLPRGNYKDVRNVQKYQIIFLYARYKYCIGEWLAKTTALYILSNTKVNWTFRDITPLFFKY